MSDSKKNKIDDEELRRIKSLDQFFEAGGVVQELPPEIPDPKKHEYVRVAKGGSVPTVKLSEYERERVPKGEALSSRLNLQAQNFQNITASTSGKGLTPGEIHAALAGRFRSSEEDFLIYVWTEARIHRSGAWATLMTRLASDAVRGKWDCRKRGILSAMASTALANYLRPNEFRALSARQWAKLLDLSCDKDWSKRWRVRYYDLMQYGELLLDNGCEVLARNL